MVCAALLFGRYADVQELRFKSENRSNMGCEGLQGCSFSCCQIRNFQSAKCSNKRSTILQDGLFGDAQASRFQSEKCSNMGSSILLCSRPADVQEFCFLTAKRSDMSCTELLIARNVIFWLRNVQRRAVPFCKRVFCWCSWIAFSGCETLKYGQCCPAMR